MRSTESFKLFFYSENGLYHKSVTNYAFYRIFQKSPLKHHVFGHVYHVYKHYQLCYSEVHEHYDYCPQSQRTIVKTEIRQLNRKEIQVSDCNSQKEGTQLRQKAMMVPSITYIIPADWQSSLEHSV